MKSTFNEMLSNRPEYFTGKGDRKLPGIAEELADFIKINRDDRIRWLIATHRSGDILAEILVEFAEDIHSNIGIWKAYEQYNLDFFGTPLPMTLEPGKETDPEAISPERIAHLLWMIGPDLLPSSSFEINSPNLLVFSEKVALFLQEKFASVPRDSGLKKYFSQPVRSYLEVKKRLIWLGTESYLFRNESDKYLLIKMDENKDGNNYSSETTITDEFITSIPTPWSGLGVIDILAAILNITPERKTEIRNWYERHTAAYRIDNQRKNSLDVTNFFNGASYHINMTDMKAERYTAGMNYFGSLVRWNNEWYWTGEQLPMKKMKDQEIRELRKAFLMQHQDVVYRYAKELLEIAQETVEKQRSVFLKLFGDDIVVFPTGGSLEKGLGEFFHRYNQLISEERGSPFEMQAPRHFGVDPEMRRKKSGFGVFYDAREGIEMMPGFNAVIRGFQKKGERLNNIEREWILDFVRADFVSPDFVRKMAEKYGDESMAAVFYIPQPEKYPFLEYILRRFKGRYYRTVYPQIGVFDGGTK